MTSSDQLMLAAIGTRVPFWTNGREVAVDGETTTVTLHGERIAELDFEDQSMVLYGSTPVSRKSTRVFNAILKEYTLFSMQARDGQWILRGPYGILTPVGTGRITVPMKNNTHMTKFIETKDQCGKAVLVNLDRVDTVTFDEENGTATVLMPEGEKTFHMSAKEFKSEAEDSTIERISGNLFHIWEILRARLH